MERGTEYYVGAGQGESRGSAEFSIGCVKANFKSKLKAILLPININSGVFGKNEMYAKERG